MTARQRTIISAAVYFILFSFVGTGAAQECIPAPSNLVSWWPGDGTATDIQGTNDATLVNGATFAPGKVGQAFSFDGQDDALVTPLVVSYVNGVTFDAWVQTTDDRGILMSGGGGATVARGMGLFIEPAGGDIPGIVGGNVVLFGTKGSSGDVNFLLVGPVIADGAFHHVAASWTGDTTANGVNLYVDGGLVATATAETSITTDSIPLNVGGHSTIAHFKLNGLIDEVEVFSRAISSEEVAAIYSADTAGKCKTPASIIQIIIERTNLLVTAGVLNRGQGNSLVVKLNAALNQIGQDNGQTAINQLAAFVNEVNALVSAGVLSTGQGQQLINLAESAMNGLAG